MTEPQRTERQLLDQLYAHYLTRLEECTTAIFHLRALRALADGTPDPDPDPDPDPVPDPDPPPVLEPITRNPPYDTMTLIDAARSILTDFHGQLPFDDLVNLLYTCADDDARRVARGRLRAAMAKAVKTGRLARAASGLMALPATPQNQTRRRHRRR